MTVQAAVYKVERLQGIKQDVISYLQQCYSHLELITWHLLPGQKASCIFGRILQQAALIVMRSKKIHSQCQV